MSHTGSRLKVLRLATSADTWPGLPEEERTPAILASMFEQATGEPLDLVLRVLYPSPSAPTLLAKWVEEVQPDAVLILVNPFWFAYESAPLRLRRGGGPVGRFAGRVARNAGRKKWIARQPLFHKARELAQRSLGTAYHYEPEDVVAAVETWLHVIFRHEAIVPMVLGPNFCFPYDPDQRRAERGEARRLEVNAGLRKLCAGLHVLCFAPGPYGPDTPIGREYVQADLMHPTAALNRWSAEKQAPLHIAAWRDLRGEVVSAASSSSSR